jgi:hypothetical protein
MHIFSCYIYRIGLITTQNWPERVQTPEEPTPPKGKKTNDPTEKITPVHAVQSENFKAWQT